MLHAWIEAGLESNIDWNWNFSSFRKWLCKSTFTSNVKITQGTFLSTCTLLIKAITVPRFLSLNSIEVVSYLNIPWHDMKEYRIKSRSKYVISLSIFIKRWRCKMDTKIKCVKYIYLLSYSANLGMEMTQTISFSTIE